MANTFIKATRVVEAALLLLQREIVLPGLVWRQADADFVGAKDDTISLRVPAVLSARTRTMRSTSGLTADDLTETKVDVTLDTHVYQLLNVTDEQLTLDIRDFSTQVLQPQMRAVAEEIEDVIYGALNGATVRTAPGGVGEPDQTLSFGDSDDPYDVAVNAFTVLNSLKVPRSGRVLVVGSNVEAAFLKSDKLSKVNESGSDSALRNAVIGRVSGFPVVSSLALGANQAFAMHSTAVAFGMVAPQVPAGASDGARAASEGLAMRYVRDYNPTNATGPVDRSLVDSFVGASSVEESGYNNRLVKITFTGAGVVSG